MLKHSMAASRSTISVTMNGSRTVAVHSLSIETLRRPKSVE